MNVTRQIAEEQSKLWNGPAAQAWVESQQFLDRLLKPFEELLVQAVASTGACRVLDVGCGTGATTLAIGQQLGAHGTAVGVDISEPMIEVARRRARESSIAAEFVVADAQTHGFEPGGFDAIVSRFGVMFFADPLQAFGNLHRATAAGGSLRCVVFRGADENPFMTTAERAAAPVLANLPPRKSEGPGQFAFADTQRVRSILVQGGWQDVLIEPMDVGCRFPEPELMPYLWRMGPVGLALRDADEATRMRVSSLLRAAFAPYVQGNEVCFTAACWMLKARA
jgi:SAM-dependent methyltransferase